MEKVFKDTCQKKQIALVAIDFLQYATLPGTVIYFVEFVTTHIPIFAEYSAVSVIALCLLEQGHHILKKQLLKQKQELIDEVIRPYNLFDRLKFLVKKVTAR